MPHAIIRGGNGRRHEVNFEDAEIRIEVHSSDETVEIFVEAVNELAPSDRRRFALLNIPKHLFSSALGAAAQRNETQGRGEHSRQANEDRATAPGVCAAVPALARGL